jgi:hypothetical protein
MILTGYLDESGTHRGASVSVMAGFVADARQWGKFEKRAGKLFKRFRVDIFHTIDVRRTDKDFEGWSVDRKIKFLDEFQHIINESSIRIRRREAARPRDLRSGGCKDWRQMFHERGAEAAGSHEETRRIGRASRSCLSY